MTTIRGLLADQPRPAHVEELARGLQRVPRDDVQEVLKALVALGLARRLEEKSLRAVVAIFRGASIMGRAGA